MEILELLAAFFIVIFLVIYLLKKLKNRTRGVMNATTVSTAILTRRLYGTKHSKWP